MKKVIDANYLQDQRLAQWLSRSSKNYAVLTDFSAMEAYKENTLKSIFKSMEIVSKYPDQVLILKSTQIVCGLKGTRKGLQHRLIDEPQTKQFKTYCMYLRRAAEGDHALAEPVLRLGDEANRNMTTFLVTAKGIRDAIPGVAKYYSQKERDILRLHKPFTESMAKKLLEHVLFAKGLRLIQHPKVQVLSKTHQFSNLFIFRHTLCSYLNSLNWISYGGANGAKPETIRNDIVDMNYVAFATYCDGLLSNDKKAILIYRQADYLLKNAFTKRGNR
jgi:hypothetical protein